MKLFIKILLALVIASCTLVLVAVGLLHGWVVPHIDDLRPRIEAYVGEKTGHDVRIGNITAQSSGYLPSFNLKDVQILDTSHKPLLTLGQVQVDVSPLSLLTLEIDRLTIDAPTLSIERDLAGQIAVAGFKLTQQTEPNPLVDWIFSQKEIAIRGGTVFWTDAMPHFYGQSDALSSATISHLNLSLQNSLRSHVIRLEAAPPMAFGQSLTLIGKFNQPLLEAHAGRWQAWTGSVNAEVKQVPGVVGVLKANFDWPLKSAKLEGSELVLAKIVKLAQSAGYSLSEQFTKNAAFDAVQSLQVERFVLHTKGLGTEQLEANISAKLSNQDLAGELETAWKKNDHVLNVKANFSHIDLATLYRYVPTEAPSNLRMTMQNVLQKGVASDVRLAFSSNKLSELKASGKVTDAELVLPSKSDTTQLPLPTFTQTSFNFDLQNSRLEFKNIYSTFAKLSSKGSARILDIKKPVVEANLELSGSMTNSLALLKVEPLKTMTKDVLANSEGTGNITSSIQISAPLSTPTQTKVTGFVQLQDNDFTLNSATPMLSRVKGRVNFNQTGFQLNNLQAQLFGGEVKLTGNGQKISGSGSFTAEGLSQSPFMPLRAQLVGRIQGKANYTFSLEPRVGGAGLLIESNLVGMQINLPAPLDKPVTANWPLRVTQVNTSSVQDRLKVSLSHYINSEFVRDTSAGAGKSPTVQRGSIMVASNPNYVNEPALPEQGVSAVLRMDMLDLAAWTPVLGFDKLEAPAGRSAPATSYIPNQIAGQFETLRFANRSFTQVVLGASRQARTWRINANGSDFNGYGEYRAPNNDQSGGQIYLRLAKLTLPDVNSKTQIEQLLQNAPSQIPALDIAIDDFEVTGKKVGRLDLVAVNQRSQTFLGTGSAQEWRVQKLNISNADATLKATGAWLPSSELGGGARRVDLQFNLDITDSGALLDRFGSHSTMKAGKGILQGRIAWVGSPWNVNIPTLTGQLKLDLSKGQFLKIEPGKAGRFLNVLSLQALPRLLTLDFRDVFSDGFAFDQLGGDAQIAAGVLSSQNLQMKSVLALVSIDGSVDLARETQSLHVFVLPDINAGGVSLIATLVNPVVGAATYLAQLILRRPVVAAATKEYSIQGSWLEPKITQAKRGAIPPAAPSTDSAP